MRDINNLSPDIVEEMLAEFLDEHKLLFIPVTYVPKIIEYFARRNPNASKYSFDRLGWKRRNSPGAAKDQSGRFITRPARPNAAA